MAPLLNNFQQPVYKKVKLTNDFQKNKLDKIEEKSDGEANANISVESFHISDEEIKCSVGDGQLSDAGVESIVDSDEQQTSMDRLRQSPISSFLPRPDRAVQSGRVVVRMSS